MHRSRRRPVPPRQSESDSEQGKDRLLPLRSQKHVLVVGVRQPGDRRHSWWYNREGASRDTPQENGEDRMTWAMFLTFLWGCVVVLTDPLRRVFK